MQDGCKGKALPLISVIIPVYNAEKYLNDCIESVLKQTYKNLEIFLVDDGSPDRSGEICDEYAKKDGRIHVIHKENGGVSSARNCVLKLIKGEYVGFIDSDDFIEENMYEVMFSNLQSEDADIAVCGFVKNFNNGDKQYDNEFHTKEIFEGKNLLDEFLTDEKIGSHSCNKLFKTELFQGIIYPMGRVYEDIAIMHEIFCRAQKVVCLPDNLYNYNIHDGSLSFSQNSRWAYGLFQAFADRVDYIYDNNLDVSQKTFDTCLSKACGFAISGVIMWKKSQAADVEFIKKAQRFLKKYRKQIRKNKQINLRRKVKAITIIKALWLFKIIYK